jgi:hypothetical protein
MVRKSSKWIVCLAIVFLAGTAQAVFIIEAHESGLANANYSGNHYKASIPSLALGRQATNSVFGGTSAPHEYVYSYTPGVDLDNFSPATGTDLGNGDLASGLPGHGIWPYNVYITWPESLTVDASGCKIVTTNDGADVVLDPVNMNTGGTGTPGGNYAWWKIAENIRLTPGLTYTITQTANSTAYCSQRSHGVLWEMRTPAFAPVTIAEKDGYTEVQEDGKTDTYTVVLNQEPDPCSPVVTVTVIVAVDPNQLKIDGGFGFTPTVLTFDHDNWDDPQTVEIVAIDDDLMEGDQTIWVYHTIQAHPDDTAFYNGFAQRVGVKILDNELQDIRITHAGVDDTSTEVSEEGPTTDTYNVRLLFSPAAPVTINITTDGQTEVDTGSGYAATAQLSFDASDFDVEKPVDVRAVDDGVFEDTHTSTINHHSVSTDPDSNDLDRDFDATVADNDCGLWGFHPMDFTGPAGVPDCVVNLFDYAEFALAWLQCTQPYEPGCVDLH